VVGVIYDSEGRKTPPLQLMWENLYLKRLKILLFKQKTKILKPLPLLRGEVGEGFYISQSLMRYVVYCLVLANSLRTSIRILPKIFLPLPSLPHPQ
jgi:hypothetical protein